MHKTKESLQMLAKIAADKYVSQSQVPLNESLTKIADEEALVPHQIEYVAAEANKAVWSKLFSMDKKASYDFPLADARRVIQELKLQEKGDVMNDADLDYSTPPLSKVASSSFEMMGFVETYDSSEAARRGVKQELTKRFEKVAQAKEEIEYRQIVNNSALAQAEYDFVKEARNLLLEVPFEDRKSGMEKIARFLKGAVKPEIAKSLFDKVAYVAAGQGLIKRADLKASEELISKDLPAEVVNGRHQLYITVKTIEDASSQKWELENRHRIVDDSLNTIKEKIREL